MTVSACEELGSEQVIIVKNDGPEWLDVEVNYVVDGEERVVATVSPGGSERLFAVTSGGCTQGLLIATYSNGEELERQGPGMCEGTIWLMNGDPSD